ncbi:MAG: hypothetical protein HY062_03845 [Bacteroidetes bacterium]|nr:hypothetical protein [Bacteroidota bacterium]
MRLSKPTYFSIFFLLCFLASFGANTYRNINISFTSKSNINHSKTASFSAQENNTAADNEFLFEENENTTENDFQAQVFLLPFFVSYFQYEVVKPAFCSVTPITEKLSNPIYIAVRNFRI